MTPSNSMLDHLKTNTRKLKNELGALYIALKRDDVPWYAKVLLAMVIGYALSPLDLIPDFIPILGYVDDLLLIPLGIALAIRLIPPDIMDDCRQQARTVHTIDKSSHWLAGVIIAAIWVLVVVIIAVKVI